MTTVGQFLESVGRGTVTLWRPTETYRRSAFAEDSNAADAASNALLFPERSQRPRTDSLAALRGGLVSDSTLRARVSAIVGPGATIRGIAKLVHPVFAAAATASNPAPAVEEIAKALLVYSEFYIPVPAMTGYADGLRIPLPIEIDQASGDWIVNGNSVRLWAGTLDPARVPLLDQRPRRLTQPDAAALTKEVEQFLKDQKTPLARGLHVLARVLTNPFRDAFFAFEVMKQLEADPLARVEVALCALDNAVDHQVRLLASLTAGAAVLRRLDRVLRDTLGPPLAVVLTDSQKTRRTRALGLLDGALQPAGLAASPRGLPGSAPLAYEQASLLVHPSLFGDTPPPSTPTVVVHCHLPRTCPGGTAWKSAATSGVMSPATMNPGFISGTDAVVFDTVLNDALTNLLVDDPTYKTFLDKKSVTDRRPSGKDRIRAALVDLTGNKICKPGFAGWDFTRAIRGASTIKVGILFALEQLQFDLQELARTSGATTRAALVSKAHTAWAAFKCLPDLDWLFTIGGTPLTVAKSTKLATHRTRMIDRAFSDGTPLASELILRIGFEYIASVLWKSGLRHPTREGIWFPNTFCDRPATAPFNPACHSKCGSATCDLACWRHEPLGVKGMVINALSVATFFTLLAQERLVSETVSRDMEALLKEGCGVRIRGALPAGATLRASKCGVTSDLKHEAALIENGKLRYVLVFLTENLSMSGATRKRLVGDLENLIRARNP
jgi:hypothetical protein